METPTAKQAPPIKNCRNIRHVGLLTVPVGPFTGKILPLYEMTNDDPDRLFRGKEGAD